MEYPYVAGQLLRSMRLEKNWSQETLCHGICAVSYLSKIEQGKVDVNHRILEDLFARLNVQWKDSPEGKALRDDLYESVFSGDHNESKRLLDILESNWETLAFGPYYADFVVLRAFCKHDPQLIHKDLTPLLDNRQKALVAILDDRDAESYRIYPCALTAACAGEASFLSGNYTNALEYYQITCDLAAQQGYVYLLMLSHHTMAACYADMRNIDAMTRHGRIAARIARAVGDREILDTLQYNEAATKVEFGDFESGYVYFSGLKSPRVLDLHKLAVCCEGLGKVHEGIEALNQAEQISCTNPLEREMCAIVRYRLEHPDYLSDDTYGQLLLSTFQKIKTELHPGFERFHLSWVTEWLCSNRQYRKAFEVLQNFTNQII